MGGNGYGVNLSSMWKGKVKRIHALGFQKGGGWGRARIHRPKNGETPDGVVLTLGRQEFGQYRLPEVIKSRTFGVVRT